MRELARQEIAPAVHEAWRYTPHTFAGNIATRGHFVCEKHIAYMGNRIAQAVLRGNGRLMIHTPPRHGKSTLVSYWTPTWFLELFPRRRVIVAAYGDEISTEWGRKVRNEFQTNPLLETKLREDSKAAGRWHTPAGGGMMAVGVGGALSGFGGDLLLCDDLIKNWKDAHSKVVKDGLYDWYKSTFRTRAEPGATIIIAMTRWSVDDLPARLLKEEPEDWEVINLPAIAEDGDLIGRPRGAALCPSRYDETSLRKLSVDVGPGVWHALYQQRPDPMGAGRLFGRFSAANLNTKLELAENLPLAISLDFNINPGNHAIIGQYNNRADMFTVVDELFGVRMDLRTLMGKFGDWLQARYGNSFVFPELHVYGDATGESEWSGTAESCYDIVREYLRKMKIPYKIRHLTKNPPLRESIDATNEALRDVEEKIHVQVHPRCKILIEDLQEMRSDENGLIDKKEDAIGHAGDCFRYWVHYMRPLYGTKGQAPTGGMVAGVKPIG